MLRNIRLFLWALVGIALIVGLMLVMREQQQSRSEPMVMNEIGGPFTLTGADGLPFSSQRLASRPHVIFFGFANCPDVCPNTLARLAKLRRDLGRGDDAFDIVLISVDPERDTPEVMGRYAQLFDTPVIALTGSPAIIEQVKKQYGVFSEKVQLGNGNYTVDHTASVFLFGADGTFSATISPDENDVVALQKLRNIAN